MDSPHTPAAGKGHPLSTRQATFPSPQNWPGPRPSSFTALGHNRVFFLFPMHSDLAEKKAIDGKTTIGIAQQVIHTLQVDLTRKDC